MHMVMQLLIYLHDAWTEAVTCMHVVVFIQCGWAKGLICIPQTVPEFSMEPVHVQITFNPAFINYWIQVCYIYSVPHSIDNLHCCSHLMFALTFQ